MPRNDTLKSARTQAALTQGDIAGKVGVSLATYSAWERGKSEPSLFHLRVLCRLLKKPPEEIGFPIYPDSDGPFVENETRRWKMKQHEREGQFA